MPSNSAGKSSSSSNKSRSSSRSSSGSRSGGSSKGSNGAQPLAWPALVPLGHHEGKPPIPLMRPVMLVGSRHNAHLHLLSRQISKAHALLINSDGKVYIRDLASRTHVYVNGQEVREADLVDGDLIKLGSFTFRFQAAAGMKQKPVPDSTPPGQLDVQGGDFPLQIDERVMLVGRRPSCDISLMEESCSTAHAVIFSMNGKRYVRDLGSRTGTFVNGAQVRQQEINFGDVVHIGDSDLRYESSPIGASSGTVDELEDLVGTAPLLAEAAEGEPSTEPAEEAPLELDFATEAPKAAADAPIPLAVDEEPASEPHTLIGANLIKEKLSSSATGMNMQDEARQAMELAKEEPPAPPQMRIAREEPAIPVAPAPLKIAPAEAEEPTTAEPALELEPLEIEPPAKPPLFERKPVTEPVAEEIEQGAVEPEPQRVEEELSLVEDLHIPPAPVQPPQAAEPEPEPQQVAFDAGSLSAEAESNVSEPPVEIEAVAENPAAAEQEIFFGDESIEEITAKGEAAEDELHLAPATEEAAPVQEEPEAVEVIEPTEPTTESALPLETVEPQPVEEPELTAVEPVMSDTTFGRQVAEFAAESPDPIVETPAEIEEPKAHAEEPTAVAPDFGDVDFGDSVGDEIEPPATPASKEEAFATTHVTAPSDFAQDVDVVEDVAEPFMGVVEEAPIAEAPAIVEQPPIEPAAAIDVEPIAEEPAFEEAVDLEMPPEAPVVDEPLAVDELPLEEFREESAEAPEAEAFQPVEPQRPTIPGVPLDWSQPATLPDFVAGVPLVLNDLPKAPPTFGRVQVTFDGGVGPQAVVDEPLTRLYGEPGPFDNLQIDIDNPVPDAPPPEPKQIQDFDEEPAIADLDFGEEQATAPQAAEELREAEPEPVIDELPVVEEEPTAAAQEPIAPPEPDAPVEAPPVIEPGAEVAPARSLFKKKRGFFGRKSAEPEVAPAEAPAQEFAASAGAAFGEAPPPGFEGLSSAQSAGNVDIFSQGMVTDLSNDPVFGKPAKKAGESKRPPRKSFEPPVDEASAQAAEKLADDLGAPPIEELPPAPETIQAEEPAALEELVEAPTPRIARRSAIAPAVSDVDVAPRPRRRKGRRVAVLLTVMVALMVASAWVIYTFLQSQMRFSGTLTYDNFGNLTAGQRHDLEEQQMRLLVTEPARQAAVTEFTRHHPSASPGYLGNRDEFARNDARARWDGGTLVYHYDGGDRQLDGERVKAVLVAIKNLDAAMVADADRLDKQVHEFEAEVALKEQRLAQLEKVKSEANNAVVPAAEQLRAFRSDAQAAEKAYRDAFNVAEQAGDELKKLELASIDTTPARAQNVQPSKASNDPELAELEKSLEAMKGRLSTARETVSGKADAARKKLDSAVEELQHSTAHAEALLKDNPELATFVAEAQKTQTAVQKLASDLLDRQQKAYEKLLENKSLLEEHLAQRRKELWESDKQIKRLKDDLAMRERGANAAREQGYEKEAADIQKELEASLQQVEARKAELESDPMLTTLNDLLARCQQEIAEATRQIDADRKQADALAQDIQKNFAKHAPSVEKLPESQRAMAKEMSQKMQAVSDARKQAADAIEAKNPDANAALKTVEQNIKDLTLKIDERKKELAALNDQGLPADEKERRHQAVEAKRVAYAAAIKTKAAAESNWLEKRKALQDIESLAERARLAKAEYDKISPEYTNLQEKELPQLRQSMQQAKGNLMTTAYPSDPKMADPIPLEDRRLPYTAFAIAGIALIFSLLIFFTGSGEPSFEPGRYAAPVPPMAAKQNGLSLVKDEPAAESSVESAAA